SERAKAFWEKEDIDDVFDRIFKYLNHLKRVLKKNTATDKEYLQGQKLLEALDCSGSGPSQKASVVQVVIGSGELLVAKDTSSSSPPAFPLTPPGEYSCAAPPVDGEEFLPPLVPVQLLFRPHNCCLPDCSPQRASVGAAVLGSEPLKVPLLWASRGCCEDLGVVYQTPCGRSLRNYDDVASFLVDTGSHHVLQVDFFTYNPSVQLELDLSHGVEPTPVELCLGDGGARPPPFRYRKDRWPHGCFLSRSPALFSACCNCADGCVERCSCVAMAREGRHYRHQRLEEPVPAGVYECGPWCGCDRARCQNRLVQRGIRVRLQVFQTASCGWGVRCRDDLDRGTFVCTYAGVILQRVQSPAGPPSPKLPRTDLPSDDEVQVVTEWLVPAPEEAPSAATDGASPPLHVPVIQRPADAKTPQDRDKPAACPGATSAAPTPAQTTAGAPRAGVCRPNGCQMEKKNPKTLKRVFTETDVSILDASKEGNVGRFFNHSCRPNLFVQNVFTDSHDPAFPLVAFFTSSVVKAGTELTWDYSSAAGQTQEVPCLC
uniref:SET domain bifurcated histone lysine methyltransferase 2 n=1 Tax=Tetraodon nigroviridis TaxID=99883 RepID=H3CM86_TETNG